MRYFKVITISLSVLLLVFEKNQNQIEKATFNVQSVYTLNEKKEWAPLPELNCIAVIKIDNNKKIITLDLDAERDPKHQHYTFNWTSFKNAMQDGVMFKDYTIENTEEKVLIGREKDGKMSIVTIINGPFIMSFINKERRYISK